MGQDYSVCCGHDFPSLHLSAPLPIHAAVERQNHAELRQILNHEAMDVNINQQDHNGNAPLHLAALLGDMKSCSYLLQYGAKVLIRNRDGHSPSQLAFQQKHMQCFNYLKRAETILHAGKSSSFTTVNAVPRDHITYKQLEKREVHGNGAEPEANPQHGLGEAEGGGGGGGGVCGEVSISLKQHLNYATNPPEAEAKAPLIASIARDNSTVGQASRAAGRERDPRAISPDPDPQFEIFRAYHVHAD
ncbi:hypothetical protein GUITHDRAFT_163983 [Guillardia theta CCMP2712]|uniref:Uncharacterized protein n=1 Tax=Guillardia theta (strain CCMP2712) TaxID=905079 RepID=L1J4B2_GUITC|nr:hypothetical protein GUITHDRAFT_163983 [Guillardia theta CCMP2712]EKX42974.1 hypothetical protein GUITHDRAFT_163983 [Guillardia theta CCMP2712]|eukprot:XP_005829954.1 hypothetical protein GUITHDRAFT_163983 [Guillardia theta CCMP2712]